MIRINGIETYPGGKGASGSFQKIINEIPPHDMLVIPFLGNCAVTRNISRADITIGIDACSQIINSWSRMKFDWIKLLNMNSLEFIDKFKFDKNTAIYCDPPYPIHTRSSKRKMYDREMTLKDHSRLLSILKKQNCYVLISTYQNPLYEFELKNWRLKKFMSMSRRGLREEYLYMNYDVPRELHDYSFLGENFRERERIKKKIKRHVEKIMSLPILERRAILKSLVAADNDKAAGITR